MTGVWIAGHSLGAARAALYAFARVARGLPVDGVYVFGCPRPGNSAVRQTLGKTFVESFRNMAPPADRVCDVPFDIGPLFEYVPVTDYTPVNAPAPAGEADPWQLFRSHHPELYQAGVHALPANGKDISAQEAIDSVCRLYSSNVHSALFWQWFHPVDGQYCAMRQFGEARLLVFRGSTTVLDWVDDFEAFQVPAFGAMVERGFWAGVGDQLQILDNVLEPVA